MTIKANSAAIPVGFNPADPASVAAAAAALSTGGRDQYSLGQLGGINLISPAQQIELSGCSSGSFIEVRDYAYALILPAETFELASGGFIEVSTSEPINVPAVTVTNQAFPPTIQTAGAIVEVPAASLIVEALAPEILTTTVVEIPAVIGTATALAPAVEVVELVVIQVPAAAVSVEALAPEVTVEAEAWTPAELTTTLWLDASDATTITQSGGAASEWRDKSGNVRHASQGTSDSRPTVSAAAQNGLDALNFDGTDDFFSLASALPLANTGSFDVYFAGRPNRTGRVNSQAGAGIVRQHPGDDAAGSWSVGIRGGGSAAVSHHRLAGANTQGAVFGGSSAITSSINAIVLWSYSLADGSTSALQWSMRIAGNAPVSESVQSTSSGWGAGNGEIGRSASTSTYHFLGLIYEIIITSSAATTEDRQRVEGYLAHKWGLTASLPSDHPYKTTAP
jgi:hypothetical protein